MIGSVANDILRRAVRWLWAPVFFLGRWVIAAPSLRRRGPVWRWAVRVLPVVFVMWLFMLGPGNLVMPVHAGFRSVSSGNIRVYFQDEVSEERVQQTLAAAAQSADRCRGFWGGPAEGMRPISLYLCSSRSRWFQLGLSADGNALTAGSSILLYPSGMEARNFSAIVGIEMSHVFAAQHFGNFGFHKLPKWAEEGLGTYLGGPTWSSDDHLKADLQAGVSRLVPVAELNSSLEWTNAYEGNGPVTVMYAHARSLVAYLIRQYGADRFMTFLGRTAFFEDSNQVFKNVYGISLAEADQTWLREFVATSPPKPEPKFETIPLHGAAVAANGLPVVILAVFGLWGIRQVCWIGRGIAGLVRTRRMGI